MSDIEIEAPSKEQQANAMQERILEYAATGASEVDIVSKLTADGVPFETAKEMVAPILELTKRRKRSKKTISLLAGGVLAAAGFGYGTSLLIGGVLWVWPFLIGVLGMAIMTGYFKSSSRQDYG